MFLCDYAEFGRKVKISRSENPQETRYVPLANTGTVSNRNGFRGNYHYQLRRGSVNGGILNKDKNNAKAYNAPLIRSREGVDKVVSRQYKKNNTERTRNKRKPRVDIPELKIPNILENDIKTPKTSPPKNPSTNNTFIPKSTPKSSRKLINKYTLGAAGLVGAGAAGYGGYKLLTRNKKGAKK